MNFIEELFHNGQVVRGLLGSDISVEDQLLVAKKNDITILAGMFMTGVHFQLDDTMPLYFRETLTSRSESPATHDAVLKIELGEEDMFRAFLDVGGRGSTTPYAFSITGTKAFPILYKDAPKGMKIITARHISTHGSTQLEKIKEMALVIERWGSIISHNPLYLQVSFNELIKVDNFSAIKLEADEDPLIDINHILVNVELAVPRFIGTFPTLDKSFQLKNPKIKNGYMLSMLKSVIHGSLFGEKMEKNTLGYAGTVQYIGSADVGFFQAEFIYNMNFSVVSFDKFNLNIQPLPQRASNGLFIDFSQSIRPLDVNMRRNALYEWVVGNWEYDEIIDWLSVNRNQSMKNVVIMLPVQGKMSVCEHGLTLRALYMNHKPFFDLFYYAFDYSEYYIKHHFGYTKPWPEYYIPVYDDSFGTSEKGGIKELDRYERRNASIKMIATGKIGIFKFPTARDFPIHANLEEYLIPSLFGGKTEFYLSSSYYSENRFFEHCLRPMPVVGVNSLSNNVNPNSAGVVRIMRYHYGEFPSHLYMTVRYNETPFSRSFPRKPSVWSPNRFRDDWNISQADIREFERLDVVVLPLAAFTALAGSSVTNRTLLLITTNLKVLDLDIGSVLAKGTGMLLRALTGLTGDKYYKFRRDHISIGAALFNQHQVEKDLSGHLFSMLFYPCTPNVYEAYIKTALERKWHSIHELRNSLLSAIAIANIYGIPLSHLNMHPLYRTLDFVRPVIVEKTVTVLSYH